MVEDADSSEIESRVGAYRLVRELGSRRHGVHLACSQVGPSVLPDCGDQDGAQGLATPPALVQRFRTERHPTNAFRMIIQ
jgi:hypothetical protein